MLIRDAPGGGKPDEGAGVNTIPDPTLISVFGKFNSFYGAGAGQTNTTGGANAFFGSQAGQANTFGGANAFFGYKAGRANTTGGSNAFFGAFAGSLNTTGSNNTALGASALFSNSTGSNNTATGLQALVFNSTGGNNTATGLNALFSNTTGSNNTAETIEGTRHAVKFGAQALEVCQGLRKGLYLPHLGAAYSLGPAEYVAEVIDQLLPDREPNDDIFRLALSVVRHLQADSLWMPLTYFDLWIVRLIGLARRHREDLGCREAEQAQIASERFHAPISRNGHGGHGRSTAAAEVRILPMPPRHALFTPVYGEGPIPTSTLPTMCKWSWSM